MQYTIKVFQIVRDAGPEAKPSPAGEFAMSAETVEDARRAALERLAADDRPVRSLSFTADGGMAAVVYPAPTPAVPPPRTARRSRGGR